MKRTFAVLLLLLMSCAYLPGIGSRWVLRDCRFRLEGIEIRKYDLFADPDRLELGLQIRAENRHGSQTAVIDRSDYQVFLNDALIGEGKLTEPFRIPPQETKTLELPLDIRISRTFNSLSGMTVRNQGTYRIEANIYFSTFWGTIRKPIRLTKEVK